MSQSQNNAAGQAPSVIRHPAVYADTGEMNNGIMASRADSEPAGRPTCGSITTERTSDIEISSCEATAAGQDSLPDQENPILSRAQRLAAHIGSEIIRPEDMPLEEARSRLPLFLYYGTDGLSLCGGELTLHLDFHDMQNRVRPGKWEHELLARAARVREDRPRAIDATAGLGEDSLILAAAGFEVQMFEQDPVIAALLSDAMTRAREDSLLAPLIARMHLTEGDSIQALRAPDAPPFRPDVIYLDPMFPQRHKSGLVGKKFQLLHHLEAPACNEEDLLSAALSVRPRKIVIKRPLKGPYLAGRTPSYSLKGKAIRYDCILVV